MQSGPTNRRRALAALTALALAGGGAVALTGTASAAPGGELVYGLTEDNRLVSFRAQTPGTIIDNQAIVANQAGLPLGTDLVGLDVRPRTGELYALGINEQLYVIDPATGIATAKGAPITPALVGDRFGFDFNPVPDRLRIISDANQNLRVNPDTGGASAVTAPGTNTDGPLRYSDTDSNAGLDPQAVAAAYTNSVDGAASTMQFAIDAGPNTFVQQNSNPGILTTIGGLNAGDVTDAGLDISPATDTTYALLKTTAGTPAVDTRSFATINRTTGAATVVGQVGPAATATTPALSVEDIAVAPGRFVVTPGSVTEGGTAMVTVRREGDVADAQTVNYVITDGATGSAVEDAVAASGTLTFGAGERSRSFSVTTLNDDFTEGAETLTVALSGATSGAVAGNGTLTITDNEAGTAVGLTDDNQLVFFSVNAPGTATGVRQILVAPGVDIVGIDVRPRTGVLYGVGSNSQIYTIDQTTGIAQSTGTLGTPLDGAAFGVDFNPVVDRLRIVSDRDQSLAVNVDSPAGTGTVVNGVLRYATGDANATVNPAVGGAGYINSVNSGTAGTATPTATTLFDVDTATSSLVRQNVMTGELTTVGALGLAAGTTIATPATVGFDIAAAGNAAFASFGTSTTAATALYRVNLTTGRATSLGTLANNVEDVALLATERATFTPPASPTPSATASASPSATATASATPSPTATQSPTATPSPSAVAPGQLTVTLNRSVITPGIPVTVTVTGTPGSIIELQAYSRPSTEYVQVRRGVIGSSGSTSFDVTPGTNTRLFARVIGFESTASQSVVINVQTALSLTVVRNGTRDYTFQGRILPRRAGQLITLYRVDGTRRIIATQIKTDSSGTYRINRKFTGSGTFGFLTRTGQTLTNAAGESNGGRARPTAVF